MHCGSPPGDPSQRGKNVLTAKVSWKNTKVLSSSGAADNVMLMKIHRSYISSFFCSLNINVNSQVIVCLLFYVFSKCDIRRRKHLLVLIRMNLVDMLFKVRFYSKWINICVYLKSEPFLFPRSGIPGSGHMLWPCTTPIWDTGEKTKKNIKNHTDHSTTVSSSGNNCCNNTKMLCVFFYPNETLVLSQKWVDCPVQIREELQEFVDEFKWGKNVSDIDRWIGAGVKRELIQMARLSISPVSPCSKPHLWSWALFTDKRTSRKKSI